MRSVLEALRQNPTDELYRQQLDSLISQQDSLLSNATRVKWKVITHHNSYTIHHKMKGFFKRLKDVFAPGKGRFHSGEQCGAGGIHRYNRRNIQPGRYNRQHADRYS